MAFNFYTPDAIKAIALFFGSYNKASKHLHIGKASLVDAANADLKGTSYHLSLANQNKIFKWQNRLSPKNKKELHKWYKALEFNSEHPAAKRAFMNARAEDRLWGRDNIIKYSKVLASKNLWGKIASKFYDKYNWQKGKWK